VEKPLGEQGGLEKVKIDFLSMNGKEFPAPTGGDGASKERLKGTPTGNFLF